MIEQGALTILVKIKPGKIDILRSILYDIRNSPGKIETNPVVPFGNIRTIHFARFVILEEARDLKGELIKPSLVFSTNYDKPLDFHLDELIKAAGRGLEEIFSQCEGFEKGENFLSYLKRSMVNPSAFYKGTPYLSVSRILREFKLYDFIGDVLDNHLGRKKSAHEIKEGLIDKVKQETVFEWIQKNESRTFSWRLKHYLSMTIVLPLLAVIAIVFIILAIIPLRILERRDVEENIQIQEGNILELVSEEDKIVQNQLTHVVDIKPGWFRLCVLKFVLFAINTLAIFIYNRGKLGSIPSIHFARWIIIDEGRRLLFFSNFDGSWENYLGDFIDKASIGLTGVWSNTVGFPKARFLILDGARDEQKFKDWTRSHQIPTQVWYSAYRFLSVQNINNNAKIREGLLKTLGKKALNIWLKRL